MSTVEFKDGFPVARLSPDRRIHYEQAHVDSLFVFVVDGDEEWGLLPSVLMVHHKGSIVRSMCAGMSPAEAGRTHTHSYRDLYPGGDWRQFDVTLIPQEEVTLDEAQRLLDRRFDGILESCPKRDMLSYVFMLHAAAMRGNEAFLPERERVRTAFLDSENQLALSSLAWVGNQKRLMLECSAVAIQDDICIKFEHALSILPEHGVRLKGGMVYAADASWTPLLLAHIRRTHQRNLACAIQKLNDWSESMHPGLRDILMRTSQRLSILANKRKAKRKLCIQEDETDGDLASLHASMPMCMRNLHERATEDEMVQSNRLHFNQRRPYYMFMMRSGLSQEALLDIQRAAHIKRLGFEEGQKYVKKLSREMTGIHKWLSTSSDGPKNGVGCSKMFKDGLCGHASDVGVTTLGQAQNRCQQYRACVLKEEKTVPPLGTPFTFATELRARLSKRPKIELCQTVRSVSL